MRWNIIGLVGLVLVVIIGLAGWLYIRGTQKLPVGAVTLTNLPDQYCPKTAQVVVTDLKPTKPALLFDSTVPITSCRQLKLDSVRTFLGQPRYLLIKLPSAIAFKLSVDSPTGQYFYSPSLGDVNGDNDIDSADGQQITAALLGTDKALLAKNDVNQDSQINVLDLALTRANNHTGADRPDGKDWAILPTP